MPNIVISKDGCPVTTSLAVAEGAGYSHKTVIQLIRKHLDDLSEFGGVTFEMLPFESGSSGYSAFEMRNSNAGRPTEYAILNERQTTLLFTYMRNNEVVKAFKKRLVKAFYDLQAKEAPQDTNLLEPRVKALLMVGDYVSKVAGVKPGIAMAQTLKAIEINTGLNTEPIRLALPSNKESLASLNPTKLGALLGKTARQVNIMLWQAGLQRKNARGEWELTEKGKQYGEALPYANSGHSGYQILWRVDTEDLLASVKEGGKA
jgi:phage regulator Rha-like protein